MAKKKTLSLDDYVVIRDELEKIDTAAADDLRDAIWQYNETDITKQGRWQGVGLGRIPANEVIEYAIELETKYMGKA